MSLSVQNGHHLDHQYEHDTINGDKMNNRSNNNEYNP
jgi:hypothetical protein